ncbi:hybrid sensor histidine kinase/response regulator [Leptospira perolatii]|nr:PAS domain-containing hybrid sensor histidine kinase/response regulator [Leptospira perolatii]
MDHSDTNSKFVKPGLSEELDREIQRRILAEEELEESKEQFRQLTDAIREVFWMVDPEQTQIFYISLGYEEIWGRSRESLTQNPRSWLDSIHPEDKERVRQSSFDKLVTGNYSEEYRIIRPDGSIRWIRDRGFPIRNSKGEIFRFAGLAEDITANKEKEQKLKENEIYRREMELQLIHAQKLEGLGTLASGIAHDFNNILTIITGHISVLENFRSDYDRFSKSMQALKIATQRGISLTRQLLTFARKSDFSLGPTQVNDIALEIYETLSETFPKNIKIVTDLQEDLPFVLADASQIHQVLLNLCVNSKDAMPSGGKLCIRTHSTPFENIHDKLLRKIADEFVVIEIEDSGFGIDESIQQKIFDPFFTTKDIGKGSGLGLSLAYSIISNHQGRINVASEPGKGTIFSIYLPAPEILSKINTEEEQIARRIPRGTETILLIEDEEMVLDLLSSNLEESGYTVLKAKDGAEGITMFSQHQKEISIIITDLGLPTIDGREVAKLVKAIHPKMKLILTSGSFEPGIISEMRALGVLTCVQKPFQMDEMLISIRNALDA